MFIKFSLRVLGSFPWAFLTLIVDFSHNFSMQNAFNDWLEIVLRRFISG